MPVTYVKTLTDTSGKQNRHVGDDKHPVPQQPAIDDKAAGRGELPYKQPPRQALGAAFPPLRINLTADGKQQNGGGQPSDQLSQHVKLVTAIFLRWICCVSALVGPCPGGTGSCRAITSFSNNDTSAGVQAGCALEPWHGCTPVAGLVAVRITLH